MQAQIQQATQLAQGGQLEQAEQICRQVLSRYPKAHGAYNVRGLVCYRREDMKTALKHFEKAIKLNNNLAGYYHNAGNVHSFLGGLDRAAEYYEKAIELQSDHAESYQSLADIKRYTNHDPIIGKIEKLLSSGTLEQTQESYLHFSIGKIYDDLKEFDKAFKHYAVGNLKSGVKCDIQNYQNFASNIKSTYSREYLEKRKSSGNGMGAGSDAGSDSTAPIFIVGMPRSGSTLIEQVLSSHSKVMGAGELMDIDLISRALASKVTPKLSYPQFMSVIPNEVLTAYAEGCLELRRQKAKGKSYDYFVDKQLSNFFFIGLIHELFPNAKIINVQRNALDSCLSCFFSHFSEGINYAFDLRHLGEMCNIYQDLMTHWRGLLGNQVHDIQYEDFVNDQEASTRALLAHCELEWEEGCLAYHKTERSVHTASLWQVRQPVYKRSVERWRHYEKHLQPLIETLKH